MTATIDELREECAGKERTLIEYDLAIEAFAELLWPDAAERPEVADVDSVGELFATLTERVRAMQSWGAVEALTQRATAAEREVTALRAQVRGLDAAMEHRAQMIASLRAEVKVAWDDAGDMCVLASRLESQRVWQAWTGALAFGVKVRQQEAALSFYRSSADEAGMARRAAKAWKASAKSLRKYAENWRIEAHRLGDENDALAARVKELEAELAKPEPAASADTPYDAWNAGCESGIDWAMHENDSRPSAAPPHVYARNPYQRDAKPEPKSTSTLQLEKAIARMDKAMDVAGVMAAASELLSRAGDPLAPRTYGYGSSVDDPPLSLVECQHNWHATISDLARHVRELQDALRAERAAHEQTRAELAKLREAVRRLLAEMRDYAPMVSTPWTQRAVWCTKLERALLGEEGV